ncbi:hypothetical protein K2173_006057 [Erythroxylum novogranatense]|uniref:Protein CHAPERONE-LIKE PROTEIN OF POR1, chloroplastic n=1 Tax=Erythroxylum novogranatense TaxID=1862640 RepID=A0AAV8TBS7_9ROSI|nr:hypothetical protein K2173_006057 [Erythroxylum novogranatense]
MIMFGITGCPSLCYLRLPLPGPRSLCRGIPASAGVGKQKIKIDLRHTTSQWTDSVQRCNAKRTYSLKCATDASYGGDMANSKPVVFPRIHVRDPYKRLGISREASEDEIQAARNFLVQQYSGHKPSLDSIEAAHDKIIMQKFYERRNPKIDVKKKLRELQQSRFVQVIVSRFQTPSSIVTVKTSLAFLVLGVLTIIFPTEEGPTLQVAISLLATIYFIYDRLKNKIRAFLYSVGAFIFSWLLGTFLMVSIIPPLPLVKGPRSFEVTTSLLTYLLLWVSSTYLK